MARPKKKLKLVNLTFRVDPLLMDTFHTHCNQVFTTRSEAFRAIFNNHINTLKRNKMKPRILIVPSNDSKQISRIRNLFEAEGAEVAVIEPSDMELLNNEFAALPVNQKFPRVFKIIGNMKKKQQKTQKQNQ